MDTPTDSGANNTTILIGFTAALAAALAAALVAGASWAVIGFYIATILFLGYILLPIVSGCGAGILMRMGGGGFQRYTKWIAVTATLVGCITGDFVWIMWATQKPVSLLLGNELVPTLNTLLNLQKAALYFIACYLAYSIARTPRGFASQ